MGYARTKKDIRVNYEKMGKDVGSYLVGKNL